MTKVATSNYPVGILISDIHYNLANLEVADKALRMAIKHANHLRVPVIVAGDLHDTKANLRGECISAILKTFDTAQFNPIVLVGNHDKINEKSEGHSLDFLAHRVILINQITEYQGRVFIPYFSDVLSLKAHLASIPKSKIIIMHQGLKGTNSGEYFQDHSAISVDDLAGRRVISGHYHNRQTTVLPNGGLHDFIGNPFTTNFGEANDPEKGYQILMSDGSLEFVPTELRRHVVLERTIEDLEDPMSIFMGSENDILWVKLSGSSDKLALITKRQLAIDLDISQSFRLDLIPTETKTEATELQTEVLTNQELFDTLIEALTNTDNVRKERLKALWKEFV